MKKNSRGLLRRDGPFVECDLERSHTYYDVVERICNFFKLEDPTSYSLYRPSGALIPAQELVVNGLPVTWTLGSYMRVKHAGPDVIQLGICCSREVRMCECVYVAILLYFFMKVCVIKESFSLKG